MKNESQNREIDWNKAHPWMRMAHQFGVQNQSWFAVAQGAPEHEAWAKYFHNLGWAPKAFRELTSDKQATMPCQWPEWQEWRDVPIYQEGKI